MEPLLHTGAATGTHDERSRHVNLAPAPATPSNGLRHAPIDRRGLVVLIAASLVLSIATILVGLVVVDHLAGVRHVDDDISRWFADRRTTEWNAATWVGSGIADVFVKAPATLLLSVFFVWRWRRWNEAALLAVAVVLEAAVFSTASLVVGRARPPVPQLDSIPLTSSYPSGHTGAAVAFYGAIAVITCWHARRALARGIAIAAAFVVPSVVGASRIYRGMHHVSDVLAGAALGAASLWVVWMIVERPPAREHLDQP